MATKYFALLTNIGAAKMAKATALGTKVEITQMAVGDGNGVLPTPDPAQTALIHEIRRAPLNMLTVDPANASQIIAEQVIPEDVGGWWIREIGLFDKDGDMIAVANCAETYKPQLQEGSGRVQAIRVILIVSSTEVVTLKIDPAVVLATRQYVDNKIIEVKSYADGLMRTHEQSRNHPDATTTAKGFTQLNSSVTDDSETQAATPKAVKIAMDNANARLAKERNLADLPNQALARQNLQLGNSSTKNTGTTADTVAAGDDARITGAMQKSQNGADIPDVAKFLQNLGLEDLAKTSANNTFTGEVKFTLSVSLPANTAYKGIGLQAWFDYKQDKDDTLTALSGKDVAGLLSYLGLTSAAKTDTKNTFTQKQTFSGSVALPSDTTLNGTGLEYLFDSKLDASKALGTGQTWVNVTASRTAGVTYTNSTTRPICVSIPETGDGDRGLYVGGVLTAFARGADSDSTLFAIVPPGAQYIFSGAFSSWAELR
ncbi:MULTISPECIES: phage tail protein [Citrobacter freundii complex]|uniref:phage tail protein n=1 Tax=Citrobacter freundii complex TaxID=1344959 RepID=UPI00205E5533|nr:phage tail protein [Citrobacter portucalensis]WFZ28207.1 phage tail protein [Citrobacter portucalensis]WFZ33207.1 phage tail protein [Citrobacter portucalensis]DAF69167.1 MAG TPA: tail collar fiber protein [Caudoviricetes sp.]